MGSESNSTPTTLTDDNSQNPGSDPLKPLDGAEQGAPGETTRITSPPSVFVNSEPIREDQVQNAVKFLSHPKVRGSPVMYRRSFLEKKGLSREEIDEAFRRVPDPPPPATTMPAAIPNKDGQSTLPINSQPQVQAQAPQPAVPPPSGVVSKMRARFHWSHAILAIGFLAASGAGTALVFKNAVVPRLKSWIRKVVLEEDGDDSLEKNTLKPNPAEEAAAAAKAAAAAASDVAKASQEMLNSKLEERKYQEAFMNMMDVQLGEMKNMSNAIRKLESSREAIISSNNHIEAVRSTSRTGPSNTQLMNSLFDQDYETVSYSGLKQATANGTANIDLGSGRPPSAPASTEPSVAPHPKSYMEIMEMIQRGEKPPGIKEINDLPPNPNQPPSNPRLAPRVKPWETAQAQNGSYYTEGSNMRSQANLPTSQLNGDGMEPSWQRKNVRISEYEAEDESKSSYRAPATEQVVRRAWVPPQPPPIAMAEAATAIRQPKQIIQPERSDEEKLIAYPSVEVNELQRITKLAESGGQVEINEVNGDESLSVVRGDQEVDGIETM
ncbi:peroxisomal membrane protein PEX14-like isoform X1 [Papaver somniferum]|uniref:peroxisomal membrane protein PEX14-like isoform X1 n=1 Tax=Papaver somniferum TaxID=3469 RepID=UPI000E7028AB|nr:peroxisomal membrane protein PEX14-like isoform X1 [Papaver somniferum]